MSFTHNIIKTIQYRYLAWLTLCLILSLPTIFISQTIVGLDPSWQLAINIAIQKNMTFGKDFIFTYGPLGFLAAKYTFAVNKYFILLFELLMVGCVVYIADFSFKKSERKIIVAIITILILILLKSSNLIHLIMPISLFFIFYAIHYKSLPHLVFATLISILGFYIKVNYGIILIFIAYSSIIIGLLRKIFSFTHLITILVGHIFLLWVSSILLNVSLLDYIISSLHLINAYNDVMNVFTAPTQYLDMAIAVIIVFAIGFIINYKYYLTNLIPLYTYSLAALYSYLLFKNGFVRADGHVFEFFHIIPLSFILLYLFAENTSKIKWGALTLVAITICCYALIWKSVVKPEMTKSTIKAYLSVDYIKDIFTDLSYKNNITKPKGQNTEFDIDSIYLTKIGTQSVDIIPWEISIAYYNKLNYNPRPVVQSYTAYNAYLDSANSNKYESNNGPKYILYSPISIDNRNPMWDESITKRTLLSHYELIMNDTNSQEISSFDEAYYLSTYPDIMNAIKRGEFKNGFEHFIYFGRKEGRSACALCNNNGYFLLQKREQPLKWKTINVKTKTFEFGKEYKIDSTVNNLYLYADINYNIKGKIKRLLFQPPIFSVELKYNDGSTKSFKGVIPIMKTGVLLNKSTLDFNETKLFYSSGGIKNNSVISIKFIAEYGFERNFKAVIKEMKLE